MKESRDIPWDISSINSKCGVRPSLFQRNRLMMELADEIVIGYASPGGNLERLCGESGGGKKIDFFVNATMNLEKSFSMR